MVGKDAKFLYAYNEESSDCMDAQADLSLVCSHVLEYVFSYLGSYGHFTV